VCDALMRVKTVTPKGEIKYPLKAVNILKAQGKSSKESCLIEGFALNCTVASQAMPKKIKGAKIACIDFNLNKTKVTAQIVATDAKKLEEIRKREADITKERIQLILKSGANVVLTAKGIDDLSLKYFVEANAMAVRRVKKSDLKRIAKATGASILATMTNLEGEDVFEASNLGHADEIVQERVADDELLLIRGCKTTSSSSIILRGPSSTYLDEMERCFRDALSIVKRTLESNAIVPGGGAVEAALSIYVENFATTLASREQLAIAEFAEALLIIPKTLAVNAAKDAIDLVAKLRAHHNAAQTEATKKHLANSGLDLIEGKIRNNLEAGVIEPAMAKVKCIQFATEAAITILRIDDHIVLNPKKEPERGQDY